MSQQVLRNYQNEAVPAVFDAWLEEYKSILYTLCTGAGKTTVAAEIIRRFLADYDYKVLATVHRREIVQQIYRRVRDHCGLMDEIDIGIEMAEAKARRSCKVIVGNIATLRSDRRLPTNWVPDVIFIDEAHRAAASSYVNLRARFPEALVIGCTATAKRTDKKCLYAIDVEGKPVKFEGAKGKKVDAELSQAVFEKHCYDYSMLDAINDGWLVPIRGVEILTDVDISEVGTSGGELIQSQLLEVIEEDEVMLRRIDLVISKWEEVAKDRPTLVFCPGVKTAKWAADHWREAGYTAADLNGETDNSVRAITIEDFCMGKIQVLVNCDVFSEGTDLPTVSCIAHLAPTKSWVRYVQRTGRGTRSIISDALGRMYNASDRKAAIAASGKPDTLVLDAVDICKNGTLCTVPAIIDLPFSIDLEGVSVTEAKAMMDEYEEVKEVALGEAPRTFQRLAGRLKEIKLLTESGAKHRDKWMCAADGSYTGGHNPPGYVSKLIKEGDEWRLTVTHHGQHILDKVGRSGHDIRAYFDKAAERAAQVIAEHKAAQPMRPRGDGNIAWMKGWKDGGKGALYHLRSAGFDNNQIDCMPRKQLMAIVSSQREKYWAAKNAGKEVAA